MSCCVLPFNMVIIQIYVPAANAEEEEVAVFYDHVQFETDRKCK